MSCTGFGPQLLLAVCWADRTGTKSQVCEEHSGKIPRKHKRKSVGMAFNEHDTSTRRLGHNRKAKESFGLHRGLSRGPRHLAVGPGDRKDPGPCEV